eukprot:symbB.v1.2.025821.t1/scaffold2533.1/size76754/2
MHRTLLTSTKPANLQNADKESCAEEGWLDDEKFGAEDKGPIGKPVVQLETEPFFGKKRASLSLRSLWRFIWDIPLLSWRLIGQSSRSIMD